MSTDVAFDRVEELARSLAREAGVDFDAPRVKRAHWRAKARAEIEAKPASLGQWVVHALWYGGLIGTGIGFVLGFAAAKAVLT